MKSFIAPVVIAALAALSACSSNPVQVRVDQDPAHSIAGYRTFGFYDQQSTDSARYQTLLTSHLKATTRQQMESRGYVYSEQSPQLLVNFIVAVRQQQEVHASVPVGGFYGVRGGYRSWGTGSIDTVTTKQGTVKIDLVDATSRSLVWQGIGEGAVSPKAERNTSTAVHAAVTEILRNLPISAAL